jgi:hypothetical protein
MTAHSFLRKMRRFSVLAGIAIALLGVIGERARADVVMSLVQPMLALDRVSGGTGSLILQATGVDNTDATAPQIADLGTPDPPDVHIDWTVSERPRAGNTRAWLVVGTVTGLPPDSRQTRYLQVTFAGASSVLDYTLTNHSDQVLNWTVAGPSGQLSLAPGDAIPVFVAISGPIAATNVRLQHPTIIEQTSRRIWAGSDVALCTTVDKPCESSLTLGANSANTLYVRVGSHPETYGHYTGAVTISAAEKPAGDPVNLDLSYTTGCRQILGVLAIAVGVFLAWSVSGYGKATYNRDQLLLPAALYREQLRTLWAELRQAPSFVAHGSLARTLEELDALIDGLSEQALINARYIPTIAWSAYSAAPGDQSAYKAFLDKIGSWVAVLQTVVRDGFIVAWTSYAPPQQGQPDRSADLINTCIKVIDALIIPHGDPPVLGTVQQSIELALGPLRTVLAAPALVVERTADQGSAPTGRSSRSIVGRTPTGPSSRSIVLTMRTLNAWAWLVTAIATIAAGSYVVILSDAGFGSPVDLLKCAFWGFGLPFGAQQLGQMTTSTAASSLGVTVSS